eukprot:TRINITY_DN2775_c0_g1_i1.p1 TRINITY_DN2775_c0_g1~~TRINITY_DN2775_c0_g1_i1.p1  ORF type:complete len:105 (+),score=11.08 TRINITY_DN2775_c0_g1_i1:357-671(+)
MKFSTANTNLSALLLACFTLAFNNYAFSVEQSSLQATNNLVKAGDKFVTLLGQQVAVGEQAPDFKVVDKNFAPVSLKDFPGQTVLISVVPSLDTGVCSIQTKRF